MATKNSLAVTLRGIAGDNYWTIIPDINALAVRKFALERELEEMEGGDDAVVETAMQAVLDARKKDATKASPQWDAVVAQIAALGRDARRAELTAALAMIGRTERSYKKSIGTRLSSLETRTFKFHPYTMDERVEARMVAEKVDENTGMVRFDPAVYAVETLRRCLEDADQYGWADAGDIPTAVGDALFEAIKSKSEPTMDEIFFIVASLPTSAKA